MPSSIFACGFDGCSPAPSLPPRFDLQQSSDARRDLNTIAKAVNGPCDEPLGRWATPFCVRGSWAYPCALAAGRQRRASKPPQIFGATSASTGRPFIQEGIEKVNVKWCGWSDSNRQRGKPQWILSPPRMPISPQPHRRRGDQRITRQAACALLPQSNFSTTSEEFFRSPILPTLKFPTTI